MLKLLLAGWVQLGGSLLRSSHMVAIVAKIQPLYTSTELNLKFWVKWKE